VFEVRCIESDLGFEIIRFAPCQLFANDLQDLVVALIGQKRTLVFADNQSDLNDAKNQQQNISSEKKKTQEKIDSLKKESADLAAYIQGLDEQMATFNAQLDELNTKIDATEKEIDQAEKDLKKAEDTKESQYEAMKLRIKFMYEHNDYTYVDMLLTSSDMSDLLNKVEYINKISEYDRNMLEEYVKTINLITETKEQLDKDYASLKEMQASLEDQVAALELLESEKKTQLATLQANTASQQSYMSKLEADQKALEQQIASIQAKIAAEEKGGTATTTKYDGGKFKWPTVNTVITSPYGDKDDRSSPHKGVDIAPTRWRVAGDPIYAAYDGKVVISTYSSSAGNYIMVYHGDGLYTRYLHASSLLVSAGDYVTKGQKIALMGTTGNSTGVHLHFDVMLNGVYVNPMTYFN